MEIIKLELMECFYIDCHKTLFEGQNTDFNIEDVEEWDLHFIQYGRIPLILCDEHLKDLERYRDSEEQRLTLNKDGYIKNTKKGRKLGRR